jgi:crotonobetainyl-CoA:carnitine CoA-transferase CaiB-like acyl-CoA transferase
MAGPLDGIRVIELANYLAAPAAVALIADRGRYGAAVKRFLSNGRSPADRSSASCSPAP